MSRILERESGPIDVAAEEAAHVAELQRLLAACPA